MKRYISYLLISLVIISCNETETQPIYGGIGTIEFLANGGMAIHSHNRTFITDHRPDTSRDSSRVTFRVSADKRQTDSAEIYNSHIINISGDLRRSIMTSRKGIDTLGTETNILVTDLSLTRDYGELDYFNIITAYATCEGNTEHTHLVLESRDDNEVTLQIRHWQKSTDNMNVIGRDTMCVLANSLVIDNSDRLLIHIKWKDNDEETKVQNFSYRYKKLDKSN